MVFSNNIMIEAERISVTEPAPITRSGTYRKTRSYIPATQVYGWVLEAITISRAGSDPRFSESTLNTMEQVRDSSKSIIRVGPGLPVVREAAILLEEIARTSIIDENYPGISDMLSQASRCPFLTGLVKTPKLSPTMRMLREKYRVRYMPIALLPVIGVLGEIIVRDEKIIGMLHRINRIASPSIVNNAGILIDRVRKTAAYGQFYTYQYAYNPVFYASAIVTTTNIHGLAPILKSLGLGYKKSLRLTRIIRVETSRCSGQPHRQLHMLALEAAKNLGREYSLGLYAYDASMWNMLIPYMIEGENREACNPFEKKYLTAAWMKTISGIYLSLTNKFYIVTYKRDTKTITLPIAEGGSYTVYFIRRECEEEALSYIKSIIDNDWSLTLPMDHEFDVIPISNGYLNGKSLDTEKEKVFSKASASLRNFMIIPFKR